MGYSGHDIPLISSHYIPIILSIVSHSLHNDIPVGNQTGTEVLAIVCWEDHC